MILVPVAVNVQLVCRRRGPAPNRLELVQGVVDALAGVVDRAKARIALVDAGHGHRERFCRHGHVAAVRVPAVVAAHVGESHRHGVALVAAEER